jgi:hypothetical protein
VSEAGNTVTWTGLTVQPGSTNALSLSFQVTVNGTDTNGQVIPNVAVFTNAGTPGCTTPTCNTNTVTVTVSIPASSPATPAPPVAKPVSQPVAAAAPAIAFTGADLMSMALFALALLGLGGLFVVMARRRRKGETIG